jgi:hypothetical protein
LDLQIDVGGLDLGEERIADSAARLLKELRVNVQSNAKFLSANTGAGTKGVVSFSQIGLALVTGGTISKLIAALFGFLSLNRKIRLRVKKPNGATLELSMDFLDRNGSDKAIAIVKDFLEK